MIRDGDTEFKIIDHLNKLKKKKRIKRYNSFNKFWIVTKRLEEKIQIGEVFEFIYLSSIADTGMS